MWELDYKEGWESKNWCFWTVVLEETLESPLDCKEIQWVHPKGNQSWIFIGRTDAEAPILWPPDAKSWLTAKDPNAVKDWRQEEKTTSEDEMVGWHHWLNGHEFEQALGVGDGQGSLACCSPWSRRESETTERLNWKETWVLLEDQQKFLGGRYYADKFCISSFHWYSFLKSTCLRKYLIFYRFSLFIYLSKNKSLISYPGECNYGALPFKVAKPFSHPEQGLFQKGGGVTNKGLRLKTWNQTFSQET